MIILIEIWEIFFNCLLQFSFNFLLQVFSLFVFFIVFFICCSSDYSFPLSLFYVCFFQICQLCCLLIESLFNNKYLDHYYRDGNVIIMITNITIMISGNNNVIELCFHFGDNDDVLDYYHHQVFNCSRLSLFALLWWSSYSHY